MDIIYKIGDKVSLPYDEYNDEEDTYTTKTITGYIFAIEVSQEGVHFGKKGYSIRYKVSSNFDEGVRGAWRYACQKRITKIGEHPNAGKYQEVV